MKLLAIIKKALIMQCRDYWALLLTIFAAPFFIFIYYIMTSGGSTTYTVNYFNADTSYLSKELFTQLNKVQYSNGNTALILSEIKDTTEVKDKIKDRKLDLFLVIPSSFSDSIKKSSTPFFTIYGEAGNPKYSIGLIFTITGIESFIRQYSTQKPLYYFEEKFMGNSQAKSEFDIYAPGIFIFSIIMLLLSASLSIVRDIEDKTMIRLKLSNMSVVDYLVGNTIVQWIIGILSFSITFALAIMLGFNNQGSIVSVLLVCSLTILSVIAITLILVAFCKTTTMVIIVGNFPLFILMFFTGAMMPLPRTEIFAGLAINDILPPTHAVIALNKIFTYQASISDITYELSMLFGLTLFYYILGIYLFNKKHLAKV